MATAARPQATSSPVPEKSALVLYQKKELATFTSPEGRALIQAKLSPGVSYETVLAELWFAIQKNPEIANCTPDSKLLAVDRALSWGLQIGDKAHLVPFSTKNGKILTAVRDYKGDIELIYRATGVHVDASAVWSDEAFDYELGDNPWVKHKPALRRKDGAVIIAAYSVAHMGRGRPPKVVVIGVDKINEIRKAKSKSWWDEWDPKIKGKKNIIPIERIPWYCEKTAVHAITKQLPTTPTMARDLARVEAQLEEEIITDAIVEDAPAPEQDVSHMVEEEQTERPKSTIQDATETHDAMKAAAQGIPAATCPTCGGDMIDRRLTKQNPQSPDYVCKDEVCAKEKKGIYWPGQWPPKPPATDEQRAEIGRLTAELGRLGGNTRTINAANAKNADKDLRTHHADALIKKLSDAVAEAKVKKDAKPFDGNLDSHPDTKDKF